MMTRADMATSFRIDDALVSRLQRLEEQRGHPAQQLLMEAIEQYVAREESRDRFVQDAKASWDAYKKSGRHLTADETRAWLETWGDSKGEAAPTCHA